MTNSNRPKRTILFRRWLAVLYALSGLFAPAHSSIAEEGSPWSAAAGSTPETVPVVRFVQQENEDESRESEPTDEQTELNPLPIEQLDFLLGEPVRVPVPVVYSASRQEERTTEAPASVIVIDRRDIELRGYSQLVDVLRDLPGMELTEYYFSEFGSQVPIRGISGNNKIVVLVNGMRVNPPGGENFPFRNDFSVRFAERIEVVYGASSTLYGQDAISAIINIVTLKPAAENSTASSDDSDPLAFNTRASGSASGGTNTTMEVGGELGVNLEREIWGWYGGRLCWRPDIKISAFAQYHDSELTPLDEDFPAYWEPYRNVASTKTNAGGGGVAPDRNDYGLNVFARLESENSSVQVWHRQSERSSAEGFNPILGFLPEAKWGDSSTVIEAANTQEWCDDVSLESTLKYDGYEINRDSRYVFPANATEWYLDDFKWGRGWSVGLEEVLRMKLTDRFSMLVGGLFRYSHIMPKATFAGGYDPDLDAMSQGGYFQYSDVPGGSLQSIPQVSEVHFWTYAAYAEGQLELTDRMDLVGGVRVTWDGHYHDVPATPRAAIVYRVSDEITAKYIYNQGFVAPAPYFAFASFDNGTLLATTNPDVAPEKAECHEINLTYNRENVALGMSVYHGIQSDIITVADRSAPQNIVLDPVFLNGSAAEPRTLVQTANGGTSKRYGVDLYGKMTVGAVRTWISYSYVDFEENNAGITTGLPGISRHNGRLGATVWALPKLFVTPSLVIRSTPENVIRGDLGREIQDPWEINLYALYHYTENVDFFLDLRNITDHHYALAGFTGEAIPQETFHGVAGVRIEY